MFCCCYDNVFLSFLVFLLKYLKSIQRFSLTLSLPFFSDLDSYQRQFPYLQKQTNFWIAVFHNGFRCDYYNNYLDEQCHEVLDRVYMVLTLKQYRNALKSIFEVSTKLIKTLVKFLFMNFT